MSYRFLPEHEAKELLEKYGIKTARCILVEDEEEAVSAAKSIGYPVVMKVAGIIHKSDVGGVILDIKNDEEVRKAFKHLISIPGAKGVTVQPMLPKGIEVIVGVGENEQFGSYVMFGLGGVFVEVLRDVSIRLLPVTREDAKEMIKSIKGFKILSGYRGFKGDIDALTDLIVKLNEIVEKEDVIEMDLNPVFVYERGYAVADARIIKGKRKRFDYKIDDLERLVYPKSVAVIGASRIEGKPGYNIVLNLKRYFKGEIYPINPKADEILGFKCYRSILDIPKDIDLAIIAVPAPFVPQVMKECAEKGVKGVVIISAGFSEEGEEGKKYEEEAGHVGPNPMIGYRGQFRYVKEPDVFRLECRAIRKVRDEFGLKNLWVMLPFVRTLEVFRKAKEIMKEEGLDPEKDPDFKIWIMVEVPSSVLLIDKICQEGINGVSFGTNDLTMLILGVDRNDASVQELYDERNLAVLRAIAYTIRICKKYGVTTSICGQAPSVYPDYLEFLVRMGANSISVNPDAVLFTRHMVAKIEQKLLLESVTGPSRIRVGKNFMDEVEFWKLVDD